MGRKQNYPVKLTDEEREQLRIISRTGKQSARVVQRAQILLWSDEGKQDKAIMALLGCAPMTVASTRERWMKEKRLEDLPRWGSKRCWMPSRKQYSWRWRAVMHQTGETNGRCSCWRIS